MSKKCSPSKRSRRSKSTRNRPDAVTHWQSISDDREKYNAYLCSREWAELREQVRERCNGVCERCNRNPMDACHHLTYARKYQERLTDLQGICNGCHEFTHGKSDVDPAKAFVEKTRLQSFFCRWQDSLLNEQVKEECWDCIHAFPASLSMYPTFRMAFNFWLANEDAYHAFDRAVASADSCDDEPIDRHAITSISDSMEFGGLFPPPFESALPQVVSIWMIWFRMGCPGIGCDREEFDAAIEFASTCPDKF